MRPQVSIIILNWNGWEDTIECLESVFQIDYPYTDVIVVDNNSQDDSIKKIKEYCNGKLRVKSSFFEYKEENKPIKIKEIKKFDEDDVKSPDLILIKNKKNMGFSGGNNVGINFSLKHLDPDYILLLNNDIIVEKHFLSHLLEPDNINNNIGILGPKIYYYDYPDMIWSSGCKISWKFARGIQIGNGALDRGQYDKKMEVEYVSGSAFLIKVDLIKKIGLLDENYFLYFEESDWALRASKKGFKNLYIPQSKVWHKISRSGGGISNPIGLYYITRNRWLFMKKWSKKSDFYFFIIYQILLAPFLPLLLCIYYHDMGLFRVYYKGLWEGIRW